MQIQSFCLALKYICMWVWVCFVILIKNFNKRYHMESVLPSLTCTDLASWKFCRKLSTAVLINGSSWWRLQDLVQKHVLDFINICITTLLWQLCVKGAERVETFLVAGWSDDVLPLNAEQFMAVTYVGAYVLKSINAEVQCSWYCCYLIRHWSWRQINEGICKIKLLITRILFYHYTHNFRFQILSLKFTFLDSFLIK